MQMVSAAHQTFEHRREGEFNTTAAPTAELPMGVLTSTRSEADPSCLEISRTADR